MTGNWRAIGVISAVVVAGLVLVPPLFRTAESSGAPYAGNAEVVGVAAATTPALREINGLEPHRDPGGTKVIIQRRIVSDLLVLAKSRRPDFLHIQTVDLAELTIDLHAKVRALGVRRWRLESVGEGSVLVDPQRITQAVEHLAHNAVQHTNEGEEILLGSALQDGAVSFWITDHGPGVSPADAQVIFERFGRGSTGGGHGRHTGAGLGLAIVRVIADAHGGRVMLVSTSGVGATFGLELPAEPAHRASPAGSNQIGSPHDQPRSRS